MPATNSLVLPLVLWDNIAPNCNLSSILINESETHIITGTTSGHIIIWEFDLDDVILLLLLLLLIIIIIVVFYSLHSSYIYFILFRSHQYAY